ncbi:MAG: class I tRNA ligase family protein, partial [Candidatus Aegiribacteria sp.]|nr:class I tRNA ligase family protein [Candidatus Aegiribacteria sp.]
MEYDLDLRIVLDNKGHMNDLAGFLKGMYWKKARKVIVEKLISEGFRKDSRNIEHAVNVHERCGTPLEYLVNMQWFIRILDRKNELVECGNKINWYPPHFKVRFDHWVENLKW